MIKLGGDCVELLRGGGWLGVGIGWTELGAGSSSWHGRPIFSSRPRPRNKPMGLKLRCVRDNAPWSACTGAGTAVWCLHCISEDWSDEKQFHFHNWFKEIKPDNDANRAHWLVYKVHAHLILLLVLVQFMHYQLQIRFINKYFEKLTRFCFPLSGWCTHKARYGKLNDNISLSFNFQEEKTTLNYTKTNGIYVEYYKALIQNIWRY